MNAKPWYQSKTIWFNAVTLIVAGASVLLDPALVQDSRIVAGATVVITMGNVALRILTNVPIEGTPADVPPRLRGKLE